MILHIDMDAFYASVELRDRPELKGQPVVVGGTPEGRGVVAAASYEARRFGIHSAMPASRAKKLCPRAVFLRPRMDHYAEVSRQIRNIFHQFTPLVEPLSLDEAFLDVTGSESLFGSSIEIGRKIKYEIATHLKLVASVGVAPNKFLAKLASDIQKPDAFVVVYPDQIQQFLDPLPVHRLWGVGKVTGRAFEQMRVSTIRDLRHVSRVSLVERFGDHGNHLWNLAHGIDDRKVVPDREAKSISHETTFAEDIDDIEILRSWCIDLADQVARRLRQNKRHGKTIIVKVRFSDFQTMTRSTTLQHPTDVTHHITQAALDILSNRLPEIHKPVRLLGVGVSGFDGPVKTQLTLFGGDKEQLAQTKLDSAADQIREKFGSTSIARASSMLRRKKEL